jgi:hypothetical protein
VGPVRSKYPVMYLTRRTCVGERYASNMDRVTMCYLLSSTKTDPSLRSLLHEPIFMMQATEYGSLHSPVPDNGI